MMACDVSPVAMFWKDMRICHFLSTSYGTTDNDNFPAVKGVVRSVLGESKSWDFVNVKLRNIFVQA